MPVACSSLNSLQVSLASFSLLTIAHVVIDFLFLLFPHWSQSTSWSVISPAGLCKECLIHFNFFFWFVRVRPPDIQELLLVSVDKSLKFVGNSVNYSWSHRDELLSCWCWRFEFYFWGTMPWRSRWLAGFFNLCFALLIWFLISLSALPFLATMLLGHVK